MTKTANIIRFETANIEGSKGAGTIATLTADFDFTAEPFQSDKPKAPTHQLFGKSPSGYPVQIGAIWKNENTNGGEYFSISIPQLNYRANLGQAAGQDEPEVQAIIPWNQ